MTMLRRRERATLMPYLALAASVLAVEVVGLPGIAAAQDAAPSSKADSQQRGIRQDGMREPAGPADFSGIVKSLSPSVVAVTTRAQAQSVLGGKGALGQGPMGELFRRFFDERSGGSQQQQQQQQRSALGSGFLIDGEGHVVTNNHVVAAADEIRVVLADRSTRTAQLVGRDPATDIAVLKLDQMPEGVQPLQWGDSDAIQPGAWTIAIGSPFGLGGTVTAGVLSARSRDIRSGPYDDFLQTDASINRGNSGGPLFDVRGNVIGVNTAIVSPSGGNIGIGFAIPSNLARNVVAELIEKGHVERGFIGATLQPVTPEIAQSLGLDKPTGALIAGLVRGGPAQQAGVRPGDVIVTFNGSEVSGVRELSRAVAAADADQRVNVEVIRDGKPVRLEIVLDQRPGDRASTGRSDGSDRGGSRRLGISLAPLDDMARRRYSLAQDETGVIVQQVQPGSAAARSGIKPGDIIVSAGTSPVDDPGDVASYWDKLQSSGGDAPALLRIRRGDSYLFVTVKPS